MGRTKTTHSSLCCLGTSCAAILFAIVSLWRTVARRNPTSSHLHHHHSKATRSMPKTNQRMMSWWTPALHCSAPHGQGPQWQEETERMSKLFLLQKEMSTKGKMDSWLRCCFCMSSQQCLSKTSLSDKKLLGSEQHKQSQTIVCFPLHPSSDWHHWQCMPTFIMCCFDRIPCMEVLSQLCGLFFIWTVLCANHPEGALFHCLANCVDACSVAFLSHDFLATNESFFMSTKKLVLSSLWTPCG